MAEASERPAGLRPSQASANSCDNIRQHGRCKFGDDCFYAHSQEESELFAQWARTQKRQQPANRGPPDQYFRTQLCQRWREGSCRNGAACMFAHGEEALRAPRPRPPPPLGPSPAQQAQQLQGGAGTGEEGRPVKDRPRWEADRPSMGSSNEQPLQQQQQQRRPQLCWYWHERGSCKHGDQCLFVHGERSSSLEDVAPPPGFERRVSGGRVEWVCPPDKYKTQLCLYFMEQGHCRHGENCNFAHGPTELPLHRREAILRDSGAYRGPPGIARPDGQQQGGGLDGWGHSPHFAPPRSNGAGTGYFVPPPPPPLPPNPPGLDPGSPAGHPPQQPQQEQQQPGQQALGPVGDHSPSVAAVGAAAYDPITHPLPLPLPSLASSDGGVAVSDDDFPPLGGRRSAAPSVRSMHSTAPSVRSQGSGTLDPAAPAAPSAPLGTHPVGSSAAGPAYTAPGGGKLLPPAAAGGGIPEGVEPRGHGSRGAACSSGGPSTPSQSSIGAMPPGSALGSPAVSEGRMGAGSGCADPAQHTAGNATREVSVPGVGPPAAAGRAESVGESASAHAPASYPASMDGSGYHAGASSSGYETAEEDAPSSAAAVSRGRPATSAAAGAGAPLAPQAPPALAAPPSAPRAASAAAAAAGLPGPVNFLAPGGSQPEQPAVEVTFNSNPGSAPSSAGSLTPQVSTELDSRSSKAGPGLRPQRPAPPGYDKPCPYPGPSAAAAGPGGTDTAALPKPQHLPLAPVAGRRAQQQQQARRRWGDMAEEEEEAAMAVTGGQASPPQGPGSPAAGPLQRPARLNSSGCPIPVAGAAAAGALLLAPPPPLAPAPQAPAPPAGFNLSSVHSFRCPLTKALFNDPVVAADGYTYERAAIHDWLYRQNQDVSPMTHQPLVHQVLVPNLTIRTAMGEIGHLTAGLAPAPLAPPHPVAHSGNYRPLLAAVHARLLPQQPVSHQR